MDRFLVRYLPGHREALEEQAFRIGQQLVQQQGRPLNQQQQEEFLQQQLQAALDVLDGIRQAAAPGEAPVVPDQEEEEEEKYWIS